MPGRVPAYTRARSSAIRTARGELRATERRTKLVNHDTRVTSRRAPDLVRAAGRPHGGRRVVDARPQGREGRVRGVPRGRPPGCDRVTVRRARDRGGRDVTDRARDLRGEPGCPRSAAARVRRRDPRCRVARTGPARRRRGPHARGVDDDRSSVPDARATHHATDRGDRGGPARPRGRDRHVPRHRDRDERSDARAHPDRCKHMSRCSSAATTAGCSSSPARTPTSSASRGSVARWKTDTSTPSGGAKRTSTARSRRSEKPLGRGRRPPSIDALVQHVEVTHDRQGAAQRLVQLVPSLSPADALACPVCAHRQRGRAGGRGARPPRTLGHRPVHRPRGRLRHCRATDQVVALTDRRGIRRAARTRARRARLRPSPRTGCRDRASRAASSFPGASPRT